MNNKTVLIFGVFDGIHDGHKYFIHEAKKHGDRLVAVVARDSLTKEFKGKAPANDEVTRINALLSVKDIDLVLLGDRNRSTYNVIKEVNPDIICLGYDQEELYKDIESFIEKGTLPNMQLLYIKAHKPDVLHSSILNKNK
jgi:FAD synthetase